MIFCLQFHEIFKIKLWNFWKNLPGDVFFLEAAEAGGVCFWECLLPAPRGKSATENSFIAAFVLNGGDRGRLLPDSESESLKMLLWASILDSAVVSFFLDDFVSTGVSFADSEDLDSALELRVVTVFLGWGCFFWPPRPPPLPPLTGFWRVLSAFLAAISAMVMRLLLSFWRPLWFKDTGRSWT